jgi:hypothetical protein
VRTLNRGYPLTVVYNNMESKPSQAVAKYVVPAHACHANFRWAARPQILFSDSVPAVRLRPGAIGTAPDIVSSQATCYKEATTEQTLTDGCGLMCKKLPPGIVDRSTKPSPSSASQRIWTTVLCRPDPSERVEGYVGGDER